LTDFRAREVAAEKRPDLMPRPAEDMGIKLLSVKKRNGEPYGIEHWIELLQPLIGNEVRELYEHMRAGGKIVLPEKFFGSITHRMAIVQQEMLDFGMDRESFEHGVVKGLKEGSRAEKAGLKEADRIIRSSHVWECVDTFEAEMELVVEREEVEKTITYWPRSIETVECLQFIKLER
jgi:predicted metalloprotease with PDZ domain